MRLLLFPIKSEPGVICERVAYNKKDATLFCSLLRMQK